MMDWSFILMKWNIFEFSETVIAKKFSKIKEKHESSFADAGTFYVYYIKVPNNIPRNPPICLFILCFAVSLTTLSNTPYQLYTHLKWLK